MRSELISANHAAAHAATLAARANRKGRGFCSGVYPITPSTECMELLCAQEIEKGQVVRVEGEHSAMAVCIGSVAGGARSFTATSSNGLAYMAENVVAAALLRLPMVMMVANRTLGPPWNIWADHGDSLLLRDSGWLQFYCADNQEVLDTILFAYRLGEDARVMLPVMVCQDGFVLSHTMAQTLIPAQEQVDRFLPPLSVSHRLADQPHALGSVILPQQTEVLRRRHHQAMGEALNIYPELQREFAEIFGRELPGPLVGYRDEDAELLILSMGTLAGTVERSVDRLRERGVKVGSLRIRLLRPFPARLLREKLARARRVAVLDRDISPGFGGVLWGECRTCAGAETLVQNYMLGLGGGDVRPEHIEQLVDDLRGRESAGEPMIMEVGV
ncbi:pyruvate ferredoxin oxidoreductase [Geothermobacter hydrogeniphilus]|nr:pyruvate ferredoxin oxidoreductase [Geothermobacter hydrogeniphilus]